MSNRNQPNNTTRHNIVKSMNGKVIRITPKKPGMSHNDEEGAKQIRLINVKPVPQSGIIPISNQKDKVPKPVRHVERSSTSFSSKPPTLTISNVICTFSTRCGIDLKHLARNGRHVELKPGSSMCHKKLRDPVCTAKVSCSGKITIVGSTSLSNSYIGARRIARSLLKLGFPVRFSRYRVVNVFASASLSFGVDLFSFHNRHVYDTSIFKRREFESELHAGANYSFLESSVSFLIYGTGSMTVTGPSVEAIEFDLERIYPYLMEFATERPKKIKPVYNGKNKRLHFISKYVQFSSEDDSFDSQFSTDTE